MEILHYLYIAFLWVLGIYVFEGISLGIIMIWVARRDSYHYVLRVRSFFLGTGYIEKTGTHLRVTKNPPKTRR